MKADENKPLHVEAAGKEDNTNEEKTGAGAALGICFGSAFGLLTQVITREIMWYPLGTAVGFGLGMAIGSIGKKKK